MRFIVFFLFSIIYVTGAYATPNTNSLPIKQSYFLGANNNKMYLRQIGHGDETIIFIHGGPGFDLSDGGYEVDPLAQRYRVVSYDQRGAGYSQAIEDPKQLAAKYHVEDLEALRKHLGLNQFTLLGLSWGSGLAMMYADKYPQHLKRMILLSPMPIRQAMIKYRYDQTGKLMTPEQAEQLKQVLAVDLTHASDEQAIANCRTYLPLIFAPYLSPYSDWSRMKGDYCGTKPQALKRRWKDHHATMDSLIDYDWRPMAKNYYGPVYVVDGTLSKVPLATTREWAGHLPNSKVGFIEKAGHVLLLDNPQTLFQHIDTFMSGQWPDKAQSLNPTHLDLLSRYPFDGQLINDMDNFFSFKTDGPSKYAKDRFGNPNSALDLTDNPQILTIRSPDWSPEPKNWSWTGWFKLNNQLKGQQPLLTQGQVQLSVTAAKLHFGVSQLEITAANTAGNDWFHVGLVQNNNSVQLYLNGQLVAAGSQAELAPLNGDLELQNPAGLVDDLRIYNGSLAQQQILAVYHQLAL